MSEPLRHALKSSLPLNAHQNNLQTSRKLPNENIIIKKAPPPPPPMHRPPPKCTAPSLPKKNETKTQNTQKKNLTEKDIFKRVCLLV